MASSPSPQQFCLRWNNHQSALVSVFDHLLQSEAFVDVTLAVEGLLLRAHKLVLSACSPYFQAMFASHPAKHPIIILKDVRYSDLRALLDFMYKGEVAIDQDRLPGFLRLAESLKIRGLAEFCEENLTQAASTTQSDTQPPIFDSLLDNRKKQQPAAPPSTVSPASAPLATAVELLPLSSQLPARRPDMSALDFSVPALGLFSSPLALTARSSSSLGSSSVSSKRPSSPQTYAHHRRKRGRPPRHSHPDYASSATNTVKYESNKDVRGSPEVMEMNVDLLSMSDNMDNNSQPTNSTAHDYSSMAQDDVKVKEQSRNSTPSPTDSTTFDPTLLSDTRPTGGTDPQPGTSHQSELIDIAIDIAARRGGKLGKGGKRTRGRPRGHNRTLSERSIGPEGIGYMENLAGPSQQQAAVAAAAAAAAAAAGVVIGGGGISEQRPVLVTGSSNNTEQLQEMSIRGLNLFRYATVSEEGMYRCIPCEKEHVTRTFKNKYSFQRHAYLYHEGNQRKVFPCLVCGREFSRPDKLKHHLKTVHDYTVPREYSNAYYSLP